jgi:hypothetical protein
MPEKKENFFTGVEKLVRVFQSGEQAPVTRDILEARMHDEVKVGPGEAVFARGTIERNFELRPYRFTPVWLNFNGLTDMVTEFSSRGFWENLLTATPDERIPEVLKDVHPDRIVGHLARENAKFMSTSLTAGMVAAAEGRRFRRRRPKSPKVTAALDVAGRFRKPAQTPDEFIDRLRIIIPDPNLPESPQGPTIYNYLIARNSFGVFTERTGQVCPARPLTRMILSRFGSLLASDEDYIESFKNAITLPTPREKGGPHVRLREEKKPTFLF